MNKDKIYNTPVEIGIRLLMIIVENKADIDLYKLLFLDYLSLHANIVNKELESLHPDNPFHGLEIYSKINISKKAINLLISKGLIDIKFTKEGISYNPNPIGEHLLSFFEGEYYEKLTKNINSIVENFKNYSSHELEKYILKNIDKWDGANG